MCGILFGASSHNYAAESPQSSSYADLIGRLKIANGLRGPDAQETIQASATSELDETNLDLVFYASELRLRGDSEVVQPHTRDGNIFGWNGEVFDGLDIKLHENDGLKLFNEMNTLSAPDQLSDLLGRIEGPYSFYFYHHESRRLYFSRDPLGRRSLLIHKPSESNPYFLLSSVSAGADSGCEFEEVSTEAIFSLNLQQLANSSQLSQDFNSCLSTLPRKGSEPLPYAELCCVNGALPPDNPTELQSLDSIPEFLSQTVEDLIFHLDRSVMLRTQNIPQAPDRGRSRLGVLFSGGIDSTFLAFLADRHIPMDEPIDLLNVAFENPRKIRLKNEGVSGVNGKRKNNRHKSNDAPTATTSYMVPDRITGLTELEELRRICPNRSWNFVEVNVPFEDYSAARSIVEALMWPGRTVMDLSLAMALYFASRGIGEIRAGPDARPEPYESPARVLLNGLGSDELLGGYGRHRTAFSTGGWESVIQELQLEIDRIPARNLGRDDRVISSHGKETRHPFLSLSLVSFLAQLPVHHKLDPRLDVGLGDKLLLRLAARKVGLVEASGRKKRAMQFGSHSARMQGGEEERRGDLLLA